MAKGGLVHFWKHFKWIVCIWVFFGIVIALFATNGVKMAHLSRDPASLTGLPVHYGLLSNLGILIWTAGASIALFSSFLLPAGKERSLLRWAGLLTFILIIDDFFLLHDSVFPGVLGLSENYLYGFYLLAFPLFFLLHARIILERTEFRILAIGLFLLGVSLSMDLELLPGGIDVEDGFKIAGMAAYAYYWMLASFHLLAPSPEHQPGSSTDSTRPVPPAPPGPLLEGPMLPPPSPREHPPGVHL